MTRRYRLQAYDDAASTGQLSPDKQKRSILFATYTYKIIHNGDDDNGRKHHGRFGSAAWKIVEYAALADSR